MFFIFISLLHVVFLFVRLMDALVYFAVLLLFQIDAAIAIASMRHGKNTYFPTFCKK